MTARLAVLASGRGSNLQAILHAIEAGTLKADVVGVFSDRPAAPALQQVPPEKRWSARPAAFSERAAYEAALADAVAATRPDWVVCAGYMRILGDAFIARFRGRLLNIHPSLLPKYRGLHTHARALEAGDREHGASVHFVTEELDGGPVILQARVPIFEGDSADEVAARVQVQEHSIYPLVVQWFCEGRLQMREGSAFLDGKQLGLAGYASE